MPENNGFTAYAYGWTLDQNPFAPGSPEHERWASEWRDHEEHQKPSVGIRELEPKPEAETSA